MFPKTYQKFLENLTANNNSASFIIVCQNNRAMLSLILLYAFYLSN